MAKDPPRANVKWAKDLVRRSLGEAPKGIIVEEVFFRLFFVMDPTIPVDFQLCLQIIQNLPSTKHTEASKIKPGLCLRSLLDQNVFQRYFMVYLTVTLWL
jgi:hypothetical protein